MNPLQHPGIELVRCADGRKWLELRGLRDDVMPWWQVAADEVRHA